ncbi:hypothetical protein Tco_0854819, partial [Tanacetum coccineum]
MDASGGSGSNAHVWPIVETPSSDGTTNEDIAEFKVASKSKSSTSKLKKVTAHKVVIQKVQTKAFPAKSPVLIRNCILGLTATHTWACTSNKTLGTRKPKDAIVAGQAKKGEKKNDAFHWLETKDRQLTLYKFHINDHDHTIITTLEIPNGLHQGSDFLQSFGCKEGSYDPIFVEIDIPAILHLQRRLFESRGCLLLISRDDIDSKDFTIYEMVKGCPVWTVRDDIGSTEFTIYEMMNGSSVWSVRYLVNIVQLLNSLHEGWSIRTGVWSICLGEREEDAFMVINLSEK